METVCKARLLAKLSLKFHLLPNPKSQRFFCNHSSSPNPLLARLFQVSTSQVKRVLDVEHAFALNSPEFSWETLVSALRSSSPEKTRMVLEWRLEKMLERNVREQEQYSDLISLCGKTRNVPLAMHVFTSMEALEIEPTSSVFNSLIYTCLMSSNVITALSLFEVMETSNGYKPNAETYNTFISGFSDLVNADAMGKWYSAKKAGGFSSNLQTYESLVSGCVKSKDFDGAIGYFYEMKLEGVCPSVCIVENLLNVFCKRRSFQEVEELLKYLVDIELELNVNMVEKLVEMYSKHEKMEEMEGLLTILVESGQNVDVLSCIHCGLIRMYCLSSKLDKVEYSTSRMLKQGLMFKCSDDFEKVISLYFRNNAYDRPELFLEHIKGQYQFSLSAYNLLVAGYRRAGLSEKLDLVIKDMESAGLL